jgi:hypothetical protein
MIRFFEFLISLLIVVVIFIVIGLFAVKTFIYSIETSRPMTTVNGLFNASAVSELEPLALTPGQGSAARRCVNVSWLQLEGQSHRQRLLKSSRACRAEKIKYHLTVRRGARKSR